MLRSATFRKYTHHDLNFTATHLQIVFVIHIHSLQCTPNTLIGPNQKHDGETTCKTHQEKKNTLTQTHYDTKYFYLRSR